MSKVRKLNLADTFHLSAILNKLDIKIDNEEVMKQFKEYDDAEEGVTAIGASFLQEIFKNYIKAEKEITEWLLEFKEGLTEEDVRYMPLTQMFEMVKEKFEGEDIEAFFKSLLQTGKQ